MEKLVWESSWSVGDDTLDQDHKKLVNIINRLNVAKENHEPVEWALEELAEYVDFHFSREEGMLKAANYEEYEAHIKEHRKFTEWLYNAKTAIEINPETELSLASTLEIILLSLTQQSPEGASLRRHVCHPAQVNLGPVAENEVC